MTKPTDEQLLEEYSKELHGDLCRPESIFTVERLIESHRENRNLKRDLYKYFDKYQKEGYEHGYKIAFMHVKENTIQYSDLCKMTIQELANLIGEEND